MKAIVCTRSGPPDVLQLQEVEKPAPKDDEVLVRVHAASVTRGDVMLRKLHPLFILPMRLFGVRRKKIPGHEFAGEIEAVGRGVKRFTPGDQVFGTTSGLSVGANAEYVCLPAERTSGVLAIKPINVGYEQAAVVPVGGMAALFLLKKGNIRSGHKVLINGASGSVGTYAVQLARYFGAEVTGVCSTRNIAMVQDLGADRVIDYTQEDFTKNSQTYDVIFDAVGKLSASSCKNALKENGVFLTVQSSTSESMEHILFLKELVEQGKLKPVIGRRFPLEGTAEAHRYVETGHKTGNVVITVAYNEKT
jgi:NADPH:quinone reductase-like Zn-dependent oxidoreductase